ncbi:MAG: tRNA (adenine(22)-N(1))-methyltransferase [Christensenellales bacterium]|jgi:tRNA A22 N-methylase|nr:class I SAM-dependent methyltransferase [Eubacteriales bacterium]
MDARIQAIVEAAKGAECVADIGTDHGKTALALYLSGCRVIAADISEKCLGKARALAADAGAEIDFRLGDGLSVLKNGECDTVVITGMGGLEIIDIIKGSAYPKYVLSPHRDAPKLRRALIAAGLGIERDFTVESSGKFYDIIVAVSKGGKRDLTEREEKFGLELRGSAAFIARAKARIAKYKEKIAEADERAKAALSLKLKEWENILAYAENF